MTPLRQAGGPRCVMVNRGWVPTEWKEDAAMRAEGQPTGKVCGALRVRHAAHNYSNNSCTAAACLQCNPARMQP